MDTRGLILPWVIMGVLGSVGSAASEQPKPNPSASLLGTWLCWGPGGTSQLVFESKDRLVYNGDPAIYKRVPGAIRVQADGRTEDYRYTLKGNILSITFPNGTCLQCRRVAAASSNKGEPAPSAKGSEWQLKGLLCSWGGSSSSGSSYSRSTRVSFDGHGQFRYASESSFSSGSGGAYGRNAGSGNSGRYRVAGNQVYLTFSDGSTGVAQVVMRQNSGRITEIKYKGQLYASGLCD